MIKVEIETIRRAMTGALTRRQLSRGDAEIICSDYLEAEMEGKLTHGLGKFLLIDEALSQRIGKPEVLRESGVSLLIDAHRELGQLAANFCAEKLIAKAKEEGIAVVGMKNASRYGRLSPYGRKIADAGLVGIVLNNAGPPAVTPFGGVDPVLGTNPICFAFPSKDDSLVMDFGTGKQVWGEIRQAILEKRELPPGSFLDAAGNITTDPEKAEAVLPFGGAKGFALCLAIEILCGALLAAAMGGRVEDQYDLGFLFLAINPDLFGTLGDFRAGVSELLDDIRMSRPMDQDSQPRAPGDFAKSQRVDASKKGYLEIEEETWQRILEMSKGKPAGLISSNRLD